MLRQWIICFLIVLGPLFSAAQQLENVSLPTSFTVEENAIHVEAKFLNSLDEFSRASFIKMRRLNQIFYRNRILATHSFHHLHRTEKVFVYINGLYQHGENFLNSAELLHEAGHNVIIGTLPGHELYLVRGADNEMKLWLSYCEYLVRLARDYGDKVIVVGHSTGGNLAVRMAEKGLIDGLILEQPLFGYSWLAQLGLDLKNKIQPMTVDKINSSFKYLGLEHFNDLRTVLSEADKVLKLPYQKISIPVAIFANVGDPLVSFNELQKWRDEFAPDSKLVIHGSGHMYEALEDKTNWEVLDLF